VAYTSPQPKPNFELQQQRNSGDGKEGERNKIEKHTRKERENPKIRMQPLFPNSGDGEEEGGGLLGLVKQRGTETRKRRR